MISSTTRKYVYQAFVNLVVMLSFLPSLFPSQMSCSVSLSGHDRWKLVQRWVSSLGSWFEQWYPSNLRLSVVCFSSIDPVAPFPRSSLSIMSNTCGLYPAA